MPLSQYGKELLLKITEAQPGQIDVSNIPDEILDDVVDEVGGLVTFHRSLRLNEAVANGLDARETNAARVLLNHVKEGILDGKATLGRSPMGHVVMMPGIPAAASPQLQPMSVIQSYQAKVKSLKKWGITYGYRIWLNHSAVQDLAKGGVAAASVIAWLPVAGWIAKAIAFAAAVLARIDKGKGIYFYITFAGVWWLRPA